MLIEDDTTKGTITVDTFADPDFWTADDNPDDALYIHRMIVARAAAGHGLGNILLDYAATLASRAGRHYIRLDAWRTNRGLIDYYKRRGFTHLLPSNQLTVSRVLSLSDLCRPTTQIMATYHATYPGVYGE